MKKPNGDRKGQDITFKLWILFFSFLVKDTSTLLSGFNKISSNITNFSLCKLIKFFPSIWPCSTKCYSNYGYLETAVGASSSKHAFLKTSQYSQENNCAEVPFLKKIVGLRPATVLKKEALTRVFYCEFCEIFKNTHFYRTPLLLLSINWGVHSFSVCFLESSI